MATAPALSPYEAAPRELKDIFKRYQKLSMSEIDADPNIIDFASDGTVAGLVADRVFSSEQLSQVFSRFAGEAISDSNGAQSYHHPALPGLLIVPSLIPEHAQTALLSRLIHRDLSNPKHQTNVHMHYDMVYPCSPPSLKLDGKPASASSFFDIPVTSPVTFEPKNLSVHKPISISKFMTKSLRWVTLGGQYDWTKKVYPDDEPPSFPEDIGNMLEKLFPEMKPQAAIVNFYSPGDTLSLHRDVSEKVDKGLVSISIGCDSLFVIGLVDEKDAVVLRLRSGDAVYMSEKARYAWHGIPKILPNTCPVAIQNWPAMEADERYETWRGWMSNKRINLNVRQMFEE